MQEAKYQQMEVMFGYLGEKEQYDKALSELKDKQARMGLTPKYPEPWEAGPAKTDFLAKPPKPNTPFFPEGYQPLTNTLAKPLDPDNDMDFVPGKDDWDESLKREARDEERRAAEYVKTWGHDVVKDLNSLRDLRGKTETQDIQPSTPQGSAAATYRASPPSGVSTPSAKAETQTSKEQKKPASKQKQSTTTDDPHPPGSSRKPGNGRGGGRGSRTVK